jgi:predicted O-methyltransferase YrrM
MKGIATVFVFIFAIAWWTYAPVAQSPRGREEQDPRPSYGDLRPPQHQLIPALDADKDGNISADEIENAAGALRKLDRNQDGKVTRDEIVRPRGIGGTNQDILHGEDWPVQGISGASPADGSPLPEADAEKRTLSVLDDLDRNQRRGNMNVPTEDGRLLRLLAETICAKHVVEIGTSNGYSSIWICLGLRDTGGRLTTYEINASRATLARQNFKRAGVDQIVTLVEGDAHEEVTKLKGSIDILFIDADKEGYIDYLKKLLPLIRPGGLILAHNTTSHGAQMQDYLNAVTTNPKLETIFVNKQPAGIGMTLKKR